MGLEALASLVVATSELKLVELIRDAIRTADLSSAKAAGAPANECPPCPCDRFESEPVFEPRLHFRSTPVYKPPQIFHAAPRYEPAPPCPAPPPCCEHHKAIPNYIQPPWAILPWQNPPQLPAHIKVVVHRPDIVNKGSLIDFFI